MDLLSQINAITIVFFTWCIIIIFRNCIQKGQYYQVHILHCGLEIIEVEICRGGPKVTF